MTCYHLIFRIFAVLCLCFAADVLHAQDISSHENRKAKLEKEIAIIDRQLSENASKSRNKLSELTLVRKKISNRKELVSESNRLINEYSAKISSAQRQINKLQTTIDTLSAHYARLVKSAYKNRDAKIWYMYIIASEDLGQAFRRYGYLKGMSERMKDQAEKIREAQRELEAEKLSLQKLKKDAEAVKAQRQKELSSLQKEESDAENVVRYLKRNRKKYEKELAAKKRQVDALNKEIQRLVAEAMKSGSSGKKPVDYKLASEFSANKGKLPWPVEGAVIERFGQFYYPDFPTVKLPKNNGVTIAVADGAIVNAVFNGVVKQIAVMPGYNQCVLVQHGNYFTFYCKLKSTSVKAGDTVVTGQQIGIVDTINGERLMHFEVWKDKTPQNPESWLRPR